MRIESSKDKNSKDAGNMTINVTKVNGPKDAPEFLTFEDGTYQVFVVDKRAFPLM